MNSKVQKGTGRPKPPNAGKGRKKGVPNKATRAAREAISEILDGNADRVQDWLDSVAKKDPKGALFAFIALLEFGVPKLSRTEVKGELTGALSFSPEQADAILEAARRGPGRA